MIDYRLPPRHPAPPCGAAIPLLPRGFVVIEIFRHDIVIVGGGCAGIRAAIAAVEASPSVSVAMVSKVYPMRSHTVSAEGGAAAVARDDDNFEMHGFDTVKGSDFLGDQDVIQYFVEEAPKELIRLEHWGCPWSRNEDGTVATRAFGGMSTKRTWYATDKVGFHMLHALFQHSLRFDRIVRYDEHFVTKLIVDGGACRGVAALDVRTGAVRAILGRAVILATGGAGKIFPFTTNGNIKTGDGMALAYREGVALKDMEFVQYHPTGLPGTGILITEATRGEGGHVKNSQGERFLVTRDYGVGSKAELGPRDMISRAIVQEIEAGRGFKGPYGDYVHLDLTHLGQEIIDKRLPMVRELSQVYARRRSRLRADPDPARRALHDGRRRHRHRRRDDAAGPLRRRRDRVRVAERRQPARLELAHRVPRVRRARGARRGAVRGGHRRGQRGRRRARVADDESGRLDGRAQRTSAAASGSRSCAASSTRRWRPAAACTASRRRWTRPCARWPSSRSA